MPPARRLHRAPTSHRRAASRATGLSQDKRAWSAGAPRISRSAVSGAPSNTAERASSGDCSRGNSVGAKGTHSILRRPTILSPMIEMEAPG